MDGTVLIVNAGSSSLKFAVWPDSGTEQDSILRGQISGIGRAPRFKARNADGDLLADESWSQDDASREAIFQRLTGWIEQQTGGAEITAAGHRVVHGGTRFASPVVIDETVMRELENLVPLAPLHQPHNLAAICTLAETHPLLPQVACFDTAFHAGHADVADRFALPRELHDAGVRRYGFHGLSYEYISRALARRAPDVARGRVVIAHLGSGASLCAVHKGKSIDSTMGFTALDGLPMGTRSGALDAGVLLHLLEAGQDHDALEHLLYHESGLLGVSGGISNDMRDLLASNQPEAAQAVDLFVYRVVKEIGALAASMGGLDGLVFTAGIGEGSPVIRDRICRGCAWLGIELDAEANLCGDGLISVRGNHPSAWVIPTNEERMIAQHTVETLSNVKEDTYA